MLAGAVRAIPLPVLAAGLVLALVPLWVNGYPLRLLTLMFQWAAMAGAWNLVAGYAGALDLGPTAPYGVGAFTVAILMTRLGWPFLPSLLAAALVAALVAYIVGKPTFRLRGPYFAVGTLALAEALKEFLLSFDRFAGVRLFGGSAGISLPLAPGAEFFYYVLLAIMSVVVAASYALERSKFGYGLKALRDSEAAAAAAGVPVAALKRRVYMLSSSFLALVGGTAAYWIGYINGADSLAATLILQTIAMAVIGGLGTPLGPVVGAAVLVGVQDWLGATFVYDYLLLLGLFITLAALFFPQGVVGLLQAAYGRVRSGAASGRRGWDGRGAA